MPIDVHAHYVPRQLVEAVKTKGTEIGVRLVSGGQAPAIGFDYGFSTRPLFSKLIEPVEDRRRSLLRQRRPIEVRAGTAAMMSLSRAPSCHVIS